MAEIIADPMEGTETSPLQPPQPSPQTLHSSRATTATLEANSPSQPAAQLLQEHTTASPSNTPFLQPYPFSFTMAHDSAPSNPRPPRFLQSPFFNLPGLSSLVSEVPNPVFGPRTTVSRGDRAYDNDEMMYRRANGSIVTTGDTGSFDPFPASEDTDASGIQHSRADAPQPHEPPSSTDSPTIGHPTPAPGPSNDSPSDPSPPLPSDASPPAPSNPSETAAPSRPPLTNDEFVELEQQLRRQERRLDRREERRERREERNRQREARREARRENTERLRAARQARRDAREARAREEAALVERVRAERREETERRREIAMREMVALFERLAKERERKEREVYEKRGGGPVERLKIRLGQSFGVLGGEVLHAHLNHHQTHSPPNAEYIASYGRDAASAASLAADEAADAMSTAPIAHTAAEKKEVELAVRAVAEAGTAEFQSTVSIGGVPVVDAAVVNEILLAGGQVVGIGRMPERVEAVRRIGIVDVGGLGRAEVLRQTAELERWRAEVGAETADLERRMADLARRMQEAEAEEEERRMQEETEGGRREVEERRRAEMEITRVDMERVEAVIDGRRAEMPRRVWGALERVREELERMGATRMTAAELENGEVTILTAGELQAALARITSPGAGGEGEGEVEERREDAEEMAGVPMGDARLEVPPLVREETAMEAVNEPGWTWAQLESTTALVDESEEARDQEDSEGRGTPTEPAEGGGADADPESAAEPMDEDDLPGRDLARERAEAAIIAARQEMVEMADMFMGQAEADRFRELMAGEAVPPDADERYREAMELVQYITRGFAGQAEEEEEEEE